MSAQAQAPTIPGSTSFNANYTGFLECQELLGNTISLEPTTGQLLSNVTTLSNGTLSNLNDPVEPNDAANREWTNSILSIPEPPENSIQYNNMGVFGSSTNLLFTLTGQTLSTTGTLNSTGSLSLSGPTLYSNIINVTNYNTSAGLVISNSTISNLNNPIAGTDALNKQYIDTFNTLMTSTITSGTNVTYTNMANFIIFRNLGTSVGTITDTTASANTIISQMSSGSLNITSARFAIQNISSQYNSILNILPGSGVNFNISGTINIWPNYELNCIMLINGPGSVTIYIISNTYTQANTNFTIGNNSLNISTGTTVVTNQFSICTNIINLTQQNVTYSPLNTLGIIYRNYNGTKTDTFTNVSNFINGYAYANSKIDYIFSTGAIFLTIKNVSNTGAILLTSASGWQTDTNSNMTINVGQTGYFYLYIDTVALTGNIYTIGIFDTIS